MNFDIGWALVALASGLIGAWGGGLLVARRVRRHPVRGPASLDHARERSDAIHALALSLDARFAAQQRAWQEAVERLPQTVQQALQIELDFLAQQQAQRDATRSQREQERDGALRQLIASMKTPEARAEARSIIAPSALDPAMRQVAVPSPAVSARPPELLLTPLPRPDPVYDEPAPERLLSDEEVDALPPDLPSMAAPRRRVLPTPKKPVLRKL